MKTLPDDSKVRTNYPLSGGCLAYFPAALAGVAKHSYIAGAKYNDGGLVHLRYISTSHMDCIQRHLMDLQDMLASRARGETTCGAFVYNFETKQDEWTILSIEDAILIECNALSWRSLAVSQELYESLAGKPLAPAARLNPSTPPGIKLLSYGTNKVAVIKAVRAISDVGLKEALDLVQSPMPVDVPLRTSYTLEQARRLLVDAGAFIE